MNFFEGLILSLAIFPAACITGYVIAGLLKGISAGIRLCLAALAGLGQWLLLVATINLYWPLDLVASWGIIGGGWILTFLLPYARRALIADFREWWRTPGCRWLGLSPLPIMGLLLLPLLLYPGQIFYEGTGNHDSYFWVSAAEWLQHHPYLVSPDIGKDLPMFRVSGAITGLQPAWGRMGTEGVLALVASGLNILPIKAYIYGQAGLFPFWLAGLAVFVQGVLCRRPPVWALVLGGCLQPLFYFYATNNNIPNLLGVLFAPVLLIGFVRLAEPGDVPRFGWVWLIAVSLHGSLCTYPEMVPFVLLVAGVAVLTRLPEAWRQGRLGAALGWVFLAGGMGLVLQPYTTWRAVHGFLNSFQLARGDMRWSNMLEILSGSSYFPALITLNVPSLRMLGPETGWLLSALLLVIGWQVLRRAADRPLAVVSLLSAFLLIGYTLATGFNYGWQKASQFSGIFIAGWFTTGALCLIPLTDKSRWSIPYKAALTGLVTFLGLAMGYAGTLGTERAREKGIDARWLSLRTLSRDSLQGQHVEVVGATFLLPFFHSMWSIYALPYSELRFDSRGEQMGGYLREYYKNLPPAATPPRAYLVGRNWADTFDALSPRLAEGRYHALVGRTNKVLKFEGLYPTNGVPDLVAPRAAITLVPAETAALYLEIVTRFRTPPQPPAMTLRYGPPDQSDTWKTQVVPYPWTCRVPVVQGTPVTIEILIPVSTDEVDRPLRLKTVRMVAQ